MFSCVPCRKQICHACYLQHPEHPIVRYIRKVQPQDIAFLAVMDSTDPNKLRDFNENRNKQLMTEIMQIESSLN